MTAQLKQLKTHKMQFKDLMLERLEKLIQDVKEETIDSLVLIIDKQDDISTEVLGDISCFEAIGLFDSAKLGYQLQILEGGGGEDE